MGGDKLASFSAKALHVETDLPKGQLIDDEETVAAFAVGQRPRLDTLGRDLADTSRRTTTALKTIETALYDAPKGAHSPRVARFRVGVHNGSQFPFDVADLHALDTELANACLDNGYHDYFTNLRLAPTRQ